MRLCNFIVRHFAHRDCVVSLVGNIQKQSGQAPGQPVVGGLA